MSALEVVSTSISPHPQRSIEAQAIEVYYNILLIELQLFFRIIWMELLCLFCIFRNYILLLQLCQNHINSTKIRRKSLKWRISSSSRIRRKNFGHAHQHEAWNETNQLLPEEVCWHQGDSAAKQRRQHTTTPSSLQISVRSVAPHQPLLSHTPHFDSEYKMNYMGALTYTSIMLFYRNPVRICYQRCTLGYTLLKQCTLFSRVYFNSSVWSLPAACSIPSLTGEYNLQIFYELFPSVFIPPTQTRQQLSTLNRYKNSNC